MLDDQKIISKTRYIERMKVCLNCEKYQEKLSRCKECGCFLLLKAALKTTQCPLDKWKKNESNSN
jgi:hypothetical protein